MLSRTKLCFTALIASALTVPVLAGVLAVGALEVVHDTPGTPTSETKFYDCTGRPWIPNDLSRPTSSGKFLGCVADPADRTTDRNVVFRSPDVKPASPKGLFAGVDLLSSN